METTAFFTAVAKGNTGAVRKLVSAGKVDVSAYCQSRGVTPLVLASGLGHLEIVRLLLAAEADGSVTDRDGRTALHAASMEGHRRVVDALLAKIDVNSRAGNDENTTPLHYACLRCHPDIVDALIAAGAAVDSRAEEEVTPLMLAARGGSLRAVRALLAADADIHVKDAGNATALFTACKGGHSEVVTTLLSAGASSDVNIARVDGVTCLIAASALGNIGMVRLLLAAGADCSMKDGLGREALKWAMAKGHTGIARLLVDTVRNGRDDQADGRASGGASAAGAAGGASAAGAAEVASGVAFGALTIKDSRDMQCGEQPLSSETAITKLKSVKECMNCGKKGENLKLCMGCKKVFLCSAECAKATWRTHKKMCKKWQKKTQQKEEKGQQTGQAKGQQIASAVENDEGGKCGAEDAQEPKEKDV